MCYLLWVYEPCLGAERSRFGEGQLSTSAVRVFWRARVQPSVTGENWTCPTLPGCDGCQILSQKVAELEGSIHVLHYIKDGELLPDSMITMGPGTPGTTEGNVDATVPLFHPNSGLSQPPASAGSQLALVRRSQPKNREWMLGHFQVKLLIRDLIIDNKVDCLFITETWLQSNASATLFEVCLPGYNYSFFYNRVVFCKQMIICDFSTFEHIFSAHHSSIIHQDNSVAV